MELIILGSSASFPAAGDACSGFLLRHGESALLIDCGSGVLGNLLRETDLARLSAIVITHFHPDHYIDLVPMRYGLRYATAEQGKPRLFVPPGGSAKLERVGVGLRDSPTFFHASFDVAEYDPASTLTIDDLTLTFQRTTHDEPAWAIAVDAAGTRFVYTSDTRECAELETFAIGADLLLCEATYPAGLASIPSDNHLTSAAAGELATRAGVGRLVLTHFWPGFERADFLPGVTAEFAGEITLAEPGMRLAVAPSTANV